MWTRHPSGSGHVVGGGHYGMWFGCRCRWGGLDDVADGVELELGMGMGSDHNQAN